MQKIFLQEGYYDIIYKGAFSGDVVVCLVMIRRIKDTNEIIYNCVCYPKVFVNSILFYMYKDTRSPVYRDWGDCFHIIDKGLGISGPLQEQMDIFGFNNPNLYKSGNYLFDAVKGALFVSDNSLMLNFIDLAIKKDYMKLYSMLHLNVEDYPQDLVYKDTYILRDCLFVVKDLDWLLSNLSTLGYTIYKGPRNTRHLLNSMSSFLSLWDYDYRENLYKTHLNLFYNPV